MLVGAHVSSAGGSSKAFGRGVDIGAEAIQVFLSAPQRWKEPAISEKEKEAFREAGEITGLPAFAHAIYLVNLATSDPELLKKSIASLRIHLELCGELGIRGLIFHIGSHLGAGFDNVLPQVSDAVREIAEGTPGDAKLIIENNAGQGGGVGTSFAEVGAIMKASGGSDRIGMCLDTCHALATGYELTGGAGVGAAVDEMAEEVGLERLLVVHANDSKTPLGGLRDRHENIGDGHLGLSGFAALMSHEAFQRVPFLLEVPGMAGAGPDIENITRLKAIRAGVAEARGRE